MEIVNIIVLNGDLKKNCKFSLLYYYFIAKPGSSNSIPGKIQSFSIKNETIPVKMEQHMEIPDSKSDLPEKVYIYIYN